MKHVSVCYNVKQKVVMTAIEEEEEREKMEKITANWLISMYTSSFLCVLLVTETLEDHHQILRYAAFGRLQAFRLYSGKGMSGSSLHC